MWQQAILRQREALRFCCLFGLYTLLCFLFLYALDDRLVVPFTRRIAWLSHQALTILGTQSWVSDASVGIPGFAVEIKNNCNAIYEIGLYASAVFAYPATLTQRTLGCLSGAAVLFLVNLLRVLSLIGIGRYFPGGFQIAHLYLWQALFLALVAACWLCSGLAGFADSLKASWRGVLLRAGGAFLILALLWVVLAPAYAHLLAAFASPLIPSIESSPGTRYLVEGTRIVAERPIMRQTPETVTVSRTLLRETSGDYPLALLAALVLATPAWSLTRRGSVFAVTVGLLLLTQFLSLLVTIEYTKLWPQQTAAGLVVSLDYSKAKMILFDWLYAFLEFMGRGFFALLLYFGAIALVWGRPEPGSLKGSAGRNAPCPCGSGLKAKRCCGR